MSRELNRARIKYMHHHVVRNLIRHLLRRDKSVFTRALSILILVSGLYYFADALLLPIYAIFVEDIGGDVQTAANAYAIFWLVAGFLTFAAGKFEDKMKESELSIAMSQFIIAAGFMLYYITTTPRMLYVVMVVLGIGNAIYWPAFHSVYSKHVDGKRANLQWGLYDGLSYIIPAGGAALGGYLVNLYGFDFIFLLMAGIAFVNGTLIVLLPRKWL